MVEAAYFWSTVVDEAYRDSTAAAVICAAGGVVALVVLPALAVIANLISKYTRD